MSRRQRLQYLSCGVVAASVIGNAMAFAQVRDFRDNAHPHCGAAGHLGERQHLAGVAEWQTQRTQNPPLATA